MRKIIGLIVASLLAGGTFAGSITWGTEEGFIAGNGVEGVAYLVQLTNASISISSINTYLAANGMTAPADTTGYVTLGTGRELVEGGLDYGMVDMTVTDLPSVYGGTSINYVVFFVEDGKIRVSDDIYTLTVGGPDADGNIVSQTPAIPLADSSQEWYSTTTSGGAPEPTALALLALGVAGLALRRKVA